MFEALKALIADLTSGTDAEEFNERDHRVAAAALLVHMAEIDGETGPAETERLRTIVAEQFGLNAAETSKLVAAAIRSDREAVDLYGFTSLLKRKMDAAERLRFIEMMWRIAYADGEADELEDNLVWRVAELLGVSSQDRLALRQRISGKSDPAID
jgi:uncharacterized tellurite resistance protein B-like protein